MSHPDLDVRARRSEPTDGESAWLVFCKACGWHAEVPADYCWKGCPNCGVELWVKLPEGQAFRLASGEVRREMLASEWHDGFRPRRRRNRWRTARPTG